MKKWIVAVIVMTACLVHAGPDADSAKAAMIKRVAGALCVSGLPPAKTKALDDCESNFPVAVKDMQSACLQELGVQNRNMALFCYYIDPAIGEKFQACLKGREADAAAKGVVVDEKTKNSIKQNYMMCIMKAA